MPATVYNKITPNPKMNDIVQGYTTNPSYIKKDAFSSQMNGVRNTSGSPPHGIKAIAERARSVFSFLLSCLSIITKHEIKLAQPAQENGFKVPSNTVSHRQSLAGNNLSLPQVPSVVVQGNTDVIESNFSNLENKTTQLILEGRIDYSTNKKVNSLGKYPYQDLITISPDIQGQRYNNILTATHTMISIKDKEGKDVRLHANTVYVGGEPLALRCNYPLIQSEHLENHVRMLAQKKVPLCVVIAMPKDMEDKILPNYFGKNQTIGDCNIEVKRPLESKSINPETADIAEYGSLNAERYRVKFDYTDNDNKKVTHKTRFIHVTNWADKTAVDASSIIALAKETHKAHIDSLKEQLVSKHINPESEQGKKKLAEMINNQPLLIHCSAGVGRTGLLMGTIAALKSVEPNETRPALEIANQIVLDMRLSASPTMVQTDEQFAALVNVVQAIINERTGFRA